MFQCVQTTYAVGKAISEHPEFDDVVLKFLNYRCRNVYDSSSLTGTFHLPLSYEKKAVFRYICDFDAQSILLTDVWFLIEHKRRAGWLARNANAIWISLFSTSIVGLILRLFSP